MNPTIMRYPSHFDYTSSIKNPAKFIRDPALQSARAKVSSLNGQPLHYAGGFAHVYVMICPSGLKYALRCWTADVGDSDRHYRAVSETLNQLRLPHFVDFEYVPQGILVNGGYYPVLRMGWVEGDSLHEFITENLRQPDMLCEVANAFLALCQNLHSHGIAHGDLQSENMKIQLNGGQIELILIDYDTLYVPALAGAPVKNTGLPAYQHPRRSAAGTASEKDDYFSELVIYLSLLALVEDPQIWDLVPEDEHDKELIFTAADFTATYPSPIFRRMRKLSPYVSRLTLVLWNFTRCRDVNWLIPLEKVVEICTEEPTSVPANSAQTATSRFDYLLMERVNGKAAPAAGLIGAPGSSWLVEWQTGPPAGTTVRATAPMAKKGDTQRITGVEEPETQSLSKFEDLLGQPSSRGSRPKSRPIPVPIPQVSYPAYAPAPPEPESIGRGGVFLIVLALIAGALFVMWMMSPPATIQHPVPPISVPPPPAPVMHTPVPPPPAPVVIAPPPPPPAPVIPVAPPLPPPVPLGQELSNFLVSYFAASSGTPSQEIAYFDDSTPTIPYFDKLLTLSDIQADMEAYDDQHAFRTFTYAGGTYRTIDADTFQVVGQVNYSVSTLGGTAPQVGRITDIITIRRINGQLKIVSFESPPN